MNVKNLQLKQNVEAIQIHVPVSSIDLLVIKHVKALFMFFKDINI